MSMLALSRAAVVIFLLIAAATIGLAVKTYVEIHEIDMRACMTALFMLFFAIFSFNYSQKLKERNTPQE